MLFETLEARLFDADQNFFPQTSRLEPTHKMGPAVSQTVCRCLSNHLFHRVASAAPRNGAEMKIDQKQYECVLSLAAALTVAVESDDDKDYSYHYSQLELLCEQARKNNTVHPFLLESLGDFTLVDEEAVDIYEEALELAQKLQLPHYNPSLQLAIAERYRELGDFAAALSYASEAQRNLTDASEQGLRDDLAEFMQSLRD